MVFPHAQFIGEHVRSARRKDAQGDVGMDHSVDGLVDGSVAAGHQNQIRTPIHGATRDLAACPGPLVAMESTVIPRASSNSMERRSAWLRRLSAPA